MGQTGENLAMAGTAESEKLYCRHQQSQSPCSLAHLRGACSLAHVRGVKEVHIHVAIARDEWKSIVELQLHNNVYFL